MTDGEAKTSPKIFGKSLYTLNNMLYNVVTAKGNRPKGVTKMKKHEISKALTNHISDAIANGFYPCMTELRGSYSGVEGSQMVFAKDNERMVFWMEYTAGYGSYATITAYVAHIALKKGESMEWHYNWPDNWKEHAIWSKKFYEVDNDWYSENEQDAKDAESKRHERYGNKTSNWGWHNVEVTDGIYGIARRLKGFKTIKRENLKVRRHADRAAWIFINANSGNSVTVQA